jgi:hypothetical protein
MKYHAARLFKSIGDIMIPGVNPAIQLMLSAASSKKSGGSGSSNDDDKEPKKMEDKRPKISKDPIGPDTSARAPWVLIIALLLGLCYFGYVLYNAYTSVGPGEIVAIEKKNGLYEYRDEPGVYMIFGAVRGMRIPKVINWEERNIVFATTHGEPLILSVDMRIGVTGEQAVGFLKDQHAVDKYDKMVLDIFKHACEKVLKELDVKTWTDFLDKRADFVSMLTKIVLEGLATNKIHMISLELMQIR